LADSLPQAADTLPPTAGPRQISDCGGPYGVDRAEPNTCATVIPAFSKRQVMDWSLVLASQDIPTTIVESDETGWGLAVDSQDRQRALDAIRLFRLENRRWNWRQPIPWSEATFHWGALGWCLLMLLIHWLTNNFFPEFRSAANFDTARFVEGEWWRGFTAILLHADVAHLAANTTSGLLLLGLAMARFGPGPALLMAYLAGAVGNLTGFMLHPAHYVGLGASGMVMGALGLISISPLIRPRAHPRALKQWLQAAFSGVFLFLLLGVNPASDVIAHLGGFAAGLVLGATLALMPGRILRGSALTSVAWVLLLSLFYLTGWLALQHR
jgi:rhomboid protease GluP